MMIQYPQSQVQLNSRIMAFAVEWSRFVGFCIVAYGFTWSCWVPIIAARAGKITLPLTEDQLATLGQFGPLVAAIAFSALDGRHGGLRGLLGRVAHWRVNPIWYGVVLFLPPVCFSVSILIHATMQSAQLTWPSFGNPWTLLPHFMITLLVGGPLGEEPGWRGFALPRLRAVWHPIPASALLGLIWAGWHLPLWWIADVPASFGLYVVGVIPLTYLFTWVAEHTEGSVLLALLFHASLNMSLVRLPVFPAWVEWTIVLWVVASTVVAFEWWRGKTTREISVET